MEGLALLTHVVRSAAALEGAGGFVDRCARPAVVARRGGTHARQFAPRAVERVRARAMEGVDVIGARAAVKTRRADAIVDVDVTVQPSPPFHARAGVVAVRKSVAGERGVDSARVLLAGFELRVTKLPAPARRARAGVGHVPVNTRAVVDAMVGVAVVHAPPTPLPLPTLKARTREGVPVVVTERVGRARVDVTHRVPIATRFKITRQHRNALWCCMTLCQGHGDLVEGQITHAAFEVTHEGALITCNGKTNQVGLRHRSSSS